MQNLNSRIKDKSDIYFNYGSIHFYPSTIAVPYLTLTHEFINRRIFTLLRTHSLPLKNNLLRWNIVDNNLCEMCDGVFVENEFHILFRCSNYKTIRVKYIPECFRNRPNLKTLHKMLITTDKSVIKSIITFLNEVLKGRAYQ